MVYFYVKQVLTVLLIAAIQQPSASKVALRQVPVNKQFINRFADGEFEVVHPFQLRDKSERTGVDTRIHHHSKVSLAHYKHTTIVIRSNYFGRLKLFLNLKEFIFVNETEFKKFNSSGVHEPSSTSLENCYYEGTVNGSVSSFVALSTCNGLRGIIYAENGKSYGIWPLEGGEQNKRRRPHVIYVARWSRDAFCGITVPESLQGSKRMYKKRDVTGQTKYFELAIVADKSFMAEHNFSERKGTEFLLEVINIADSIFFHNLNIRLSVVYAELWMDKQRITAEKDIERTLSDAVAYATGPIYQIKKDASIFLTGEGFANNEITSSTFGDACTSRGTALVTAVDAFTAHETGLALAHGLAHLLSIGHDDGNCECGSAGGCAMRKQLGAQNSSFSWELSRCSVEQLHKNLQLGHLQCLLNKPRQASSLQLCGNGVVDDEEECDCGSREECKDECCDPLTCTLRSEAQCASHQACCRQCKVLPKSHVCRKQRSACDVKEECDGENGDCPVDGYFVDGTTCGINGQCWKGECADVENQCKLLWGNDSAAAEELCFERNTKGTEDANCGIDKDNKFKKCAQDDVLCGLLHCQGGSPFPLQQSFNTYIVQIQHDKRYIQCKTVNQSSMAIVPDGTSCGSGKVCVQRKCLLLSDVSSRVDCPTTNLALPCSGHGDCVTSMRCVCYSGWAGAACNIRLNTSKSPLQTTTAADDILIPSLAAGRTLNTTTLLAILLFVGVVLLMLLVCLLFCYRRRSTNVFLDGPLDEKLNESIPENTDRAIKFGNMPSYREEKRKRKKNKRVYDALHRINEASDERDSVSLKSRDSGGKNSAVGSANGSAVGCPEAVVGYGIEGNHMFNRIVNGSSSSILKNGGVNRRLFHDGEIYSRSPCSEILGSPSRYTALGRNGLRYEKNRSGYATDTELGANPYAPHYVDTLSMTRVDVSPTMSDSSVTRLAPTPLKLNNIGILLKQLRYNDDIASETELTTLEADNLDCLELGSNTESSRGCEMHEPIKLSSSGELPEVCEVHIASPISLETRRSPGMPSDDGITAQKASNATTNGSWHELEKGCDDDCRSESRIKQLSATAPQGSNVDQSPSLFSDSFRLEL